MNEVASLELCKELYELSGWGDTDKWLIVNEFGEPSLIGSKAVHNKSYPAYSAGYLLRKLRDDVSDFSFIPQSDGKWYFGYTVFGNFKTNNMFADTPEDALCKLSCELFKQGILTK